MGAVAVMCIQTSIKATKIRITTRTKLNKTLIGNNFNKETVINHQIILTIKDTIITITPNTLKKQIKLCRTMQIATTTRTRTKGMILRIHSFL